MRLNPFILLLTIVAGIVGAVATVRAFSTYDGAAGAFTDVELQYVPDSFRWLDPDFDQGEARFRVVNDSDFDATVESFGISLRFDGTFAGSDYDRWEFQTVSSGDQFEFPVRFSVTANSIQSGGGEAVLGFTGQMRVVFDEFEQALNFRFRGEIGITPYENPSP